MEDKEPQILVNQIRTPDGTILVSKHRHDFVEYTDKNRLTFSVDGGTDYLKRGVGFSPSYKGLSDKEINYINELGIIYCPTSGRFFDKNYNLKDTAIDFDGYRHVFILNKNYKAHRLVFMFSGISDIDEVDHVNNLRSDNRWVNLRLASKSENQSNSSIRKDNSTGIKGLSYHKAKKIWIGRVQHKNKRHEVSSKNKEKCVNKLIALRSRLHGEFSNNGNNIKTTDFKHLYEEISLTDADPFEKIREHFCRGGRGKDGKQPLTWVPLCKMSNDWVKGVIDYEKKHRPHNRFLNLFEKELEYRQENRIFVADN